MKNIDFLHDFSHHSHLHFCSQCISSYLHSLIHFLSFFFGFSFLSEISSISLFLTIKRIFYSTSFCFYFSINFYQEFHLPQNITSKKLFPFSDHGPPLHKDIYFLIPRSVCTKKITGRNSSTIEDEESITFRFFVNISSIFLHSSFSFNKFMNFSFLFENCERVNFFHGTFK